MNRNHQYEVWVKLQLALCFLWLMILQLWYLPPPAVSNSSCLFTLWQALHTSCCTILLNFSRYCTVSLKMFYFLCLSFMYYLCEKYYRPITVQHYTGDFDSWVPKLPLLDLQMCSRIGTSLFVGVFLYLSFLLKLAPQFIGCWTVSVWTYGWLYSKQYQHLGCTFRNFNLVVLE